MQQDLRLIYYEVLSEEEQMQDTYDKETNYSLDFKQQQLWNHKIDEELKSLGEFYR